MATKPTENSLERSNTKSTAVFTFALLRQKLLQYWPLLLIIAVFLALHIPGIKTPPIDEHAWRQTDTASVIRNFAEESANIFFPRIDMRGQYSGITGMEFPIYNYIVFLVNKLFGFTHWHGRVVSLGFATLGLLYFYGLVKNLWDKKRALLSTAILAFSPLFFMFSKNIQPDILMVAMSIASLYYVQKYTQEQDKTSYLIASFVALSLAILVKLPAVFVVIPYLWLIGWRHTINLIKKYWLAGVLIVALPSLLWYMWSNYLSSHFGLGSYFYGDFSWKLTWPIIKTSGFYNTIREYVFTSRFPYSLLYGLLIVGAFNVGKDRRDWFTLVWFGSIALFLVLFGSKSLYHSYYSLPLVPAFAILVAKGALDIANLLRKNNKLAVWLIVLVAAIYAKSLVIGQTHALYKADFVYSNNLEQIMDRFSTKDDRLIVNWNGVPIFLYYAHRKGWSVADTSETTIASLKSQGAKFLLLDVTGSGGVAPKDAHYSKYKLVYHDAHFYIYQL